MTFASSFAGVREGWNLYRPEVQVVLAQAYKPGAKGVCPVDPGLVFEVFRHLGPQDVRVVVLGQDPYPRARDACGVSFMSPVAVPRSAGSIFDNLIRFGHMRDEQRPLVADLRGWLRQGVLLVNTAPTVFEGEPLSHQEIWRGLAERVLANVPVQSVGLRLGVVAQTVRLPCAAVVDHTHPVLPSIEEFQKKDCFGDVNRLLRAMRMEPVRWTDTT